MAKTTIYFDGGCPLCRAEIAHYARKDSTGVLTLVDVADESSSLPEGTDRATLLGRFHVVTRDDRLLSGAAAFVEVWRRLPGWRLLAGFARVPGVTLAMEGVYRLFLPLRPVIVRAFVALAGVEARTVTRHLARAAALCGLLAAPTASGDPMMTEDFTDGASPSWAFFTDRVMGGVSTGQAAIETEGGERFLRLQGRVSTENNGGFIQARVEPSAPVAGNARGVEIEVRGNAQTYYLHLRTGGTRLPWQFYQAPFEVSPDWAVLRIPFTEFAAKGRLLRKTFAPDTIRSLAVAAYGRDHVADVSVRRIGFY